MSDDPKDREALYIRLPKRFRTASLSDFKGGLSKLKPENLFLTGDNGVGKTHLAAAIVNEYDGRWWFVPHMLMTIRDTFRPGSGTTELQFMNAWSVMSLPVVLDDLGAEKTSEWSLQTLLVILNNRLENEHPTIITTNKTLDEIHALDPRIASRLSAYRQIVLEGDDRRATRQPVRSA